MAVILNIESATTNCSVSVAREGKILSLIEEDHGQYSHSEQLHIFIQRSLAEAKVQAQELDAVAVGKGPGSYTGLRIGVSTAKGLCYALEIPLIALNTMEIMARSVNIEDGYLIPLLDARRMEVYASVFDHRWHPVKPTWAEVVDENSFAEFIKDKPVHLLGNGTAKCREILREGNLKYFPDVVPSAESMAMMSYAAFRRQSFENTAYFEPFYLKDFIATKAKKQS